MKGVATFGCLEINLDQTDGDCLAVRRNIMRARSVWGRLWILIRREGGDPSVAEIFYRAVVQVILLYGSDTWVLSASMEK